MKPLLLTLTTGALLALSLPPYDVERLGWLALAPLLVAARGRRALEAMGLGIAAGLICGFLHVGWRPDAQGEFAFLPFLWLAMLLGGVALLAAWARQRWEGTRWVLFVTCAAVAVEWLTTFSPLPIHLALCQYRAVSVIQIAALTGIWGVSFLVWWVNAALADTALRRGQTGKGRWPGQRLASAGEPRGAGPARARLLRGPIGIALAGLAATVGYSHFALTYLAGQARGLPLRVAAIQEFSAAESAPFVRDAALSLNEGDRGAMTRRAAADGAKLVVWSEGCLGATFVPDSDEDATRALARELNVYLVPGYSQAAQPKPFNCAALLAPDGRVEGIHRKIHAFLGERQAIQCGHEARAFVTALGKVGLEICFDSCCPDVTRRIAAAGARLIAMPNWDPPTPRGILHRLHAAMLPFRAVENHVPFVRADANGLSQIIDAHGRILAQAPLFAADTLIADLPLGDGHGTLFTRLGDWLAYLCVLVVAGFCVGGARARLRMPGGGEGASPGAPSFTSSHQATTS